MKKEFKAYKTLLEKAGNIESKTKDHLQVIDTYYADHIQQVENSAPPIKGKAAIKAMEIKNLQGVHSVKTIIKNVVKDEENGLVWGEMMIHFDSIKSGKSRLEEAFMQRWEGGKIVYQRFFYGAMKQEEKNSQNELSSD